MLCKADTLGVFQVESRAQMNILPRMQPRTFYDLVIEVAIVRPGPIQGDMVHPYLRRRNGEEPVELPVRRARRRCWARPWACRSSRSRRCRSPSSAPASPRTRPTACAARWPPSRSTATSANSTTASWRAWRQNGYDADFAERCFTQIEGFGYYGFPESHAASFALLVYASAWLKRHHPGIFACALLNTQPMGFYAPAQIVRDAREHGVEVRPV